MDHVTFARFLRKNQTKPEARLWAMLRNRANGFKFRRQVPRGPYVLDFVCMERRFVVEVDGGQHCESAYDAERDAWLAARGFRVMRFWNLEVLGNPDGVWEAISLALGDPSPPLAGTLSPAGERGLLDWRDDP